MKRTFTLTDESVVNIVIEDLKDAYQMLPECEHDGKLAKGIRQVLKYYMPTHEYRAWRDGDQPEIDYGKDTLF